MELEDSTPLTTEHEGLDSGLGDALPTSDKKLHSSADNLEPVETEMLEAVEKASTHKTRGKLRSVQLERASLLPVAIPDVTESQPLRKSSRKKQKTDLESDKILERRRKKSLEKVAEWLMKVPPEGSLELEAPDKDPDDSDGCSSTSTIDVKQHVSDINSKREDRAKALEDHVFGAVYKRDRRGKRSISRPLFVEPTIINHKTDSEDENRSDSEEEQLLTEDVNDSSDILREAEQMEDLEENDVVDKDVIAESESEPQQLKRKSKKRMQNALQQVDSDLKEQAEAEAEKTQPKKPDRRKGKNTRSEKGKPARVSKPLVLVGVKNGETNPKTRAKSEEVQVQIENYPSSEDQQTPIRSNRRSRRLQLFAEEVQDTHKKANSRANAIEKDVSVAQQQEDVEGETPDKAESPKGEKLAKRNGCVYDEDLGGIENVKSGKRTRREQESIAEVQNLPNAETLSEAAVACSVPVVPSSPCPTEATVVGPTLENNNLTDQSSTNIELKTSACVITEKEEEKNDSELDTEQLLQSFKATKRKSFRLGGPKGKRSRSSVQENTQGAEGEENDFVCSSVESAKTQTNKKTSGIVDQEALKDDETSSGSDLISPSISPILTVEKTVEKPDQVVVEALNPLTSSSGQDGQSSALTPNQVSKSEIESPQFVESGLRFTDVEHEEVNEASQSSHIPNGQLDGSVKDAGKWKEMRDSRKGEPILVAESSLTPDGLVTPLVPAVHGSEELSAHSPVKSNLRKRRRTQRLESSSESDESREELPTLTQIFGTSALPAAVTRDRGDSREATGCEAACVPADAAERLSRPPTCPSPERVASSQGSVDLFGTPEECK